MKIINVDDKIFIHCSDNDLYNYIKANYVDEVTDPENEQLLDDLTEMAGDDVVHAYLNYDESVENWYIDRTEVVPSDKD